MGSLSLPSSRIDTRSACHVLGRLLAALACQAALCIPASAQKPTFDPATLTPQNFYKVLEPLARAEGTLVFYNSAGDFDPIWKTGLIPRFEARYGIKVDYVNVRREQADQQLIAVHRARAPAPVDVYFAGGSDRFGLLDGAGVVAGIDLSSIVPNLAAVAPDYKGVVFGVDTHGRWPIVHVNQVALGYDSAQLAAAEVPSSFEDLLAWAERHPKKFAFTSPAKGGSGSGFLYSAAVHLVKDERCRKTLLDAHMSEDDAAVWAESASCLQPLWAYMERLLKASEVTNGNADTLNLLNNREVLIGTVWEDLARTFVVRKLLPPRFRMALLRDGMAAGGDGLMLPADARHKAAALLFIDMAFDKDFQSWKLVNYSSRSPRPDVERQAAELDESHGLVPAAQMSASSIPVNFRAAHALTHALEDKVLTKL